MTTRIAILDLGAANSASVRYAFEALGCTTQTISTAVEIEQSNAIVLPGVAHFGYLARALDERGLRLPLEAAASAGVPLLGICAGFQLLYEASEEAPSERGLGVFPGTVRRFPGLRRQHVGWNFVQARPNAFCNSDWAYFSHGYAPVQQLSDTLAWSIHNGTRFTCAAQRGNVFGVQFHPERSGEFGREILRRFASAGSIAYAR